MAKFNTKVSIPIYQFQFTEEEVILLFNLLILVVGRSVDVNSLGRRGMVEDIVKAIEKSLELTEIECSTGEDNLSRFTYPEGCIEGLITV